MVTRRTSALVLDLLGHDFYNHLKFNVTLNGGAGSQNRLRERAGGGNSNDERGTMNDELKPQAFFFHSAFIVPRSSFDGQAVLT
jgi:hypothetical protein